MPRRATTPALSKCATNVSIRRDLLEAARACNLNLSATLEKALTEELQRERARKWRDENREAIANYNEHVLKHGVFSDGSRSF